MQFMDRTEAGHKLAQALLPYREGAVVYALPRGGVVLGAEVARELDVPMDLIMAHKLGHPDDPEYAIGAVAETNDPVLDPMAMGIHDVWLQNVIRSAQAENARRRRSYFPHSYISPVIEGLTAIIVDDGIATGFTMMAAAQAVHAHSPERIVVAVPVAPADAIVKLFDLVDDVVVLGRPNEFRGSIGRHYLYFPEVTDQEVIATLADASHQSVERT